MGEKKEKAKSILGFIALGCALAVACVVAAPALAVVGVVVGTTTIISASTVVGVTAVVATVGATAAVTKAALHVSDGEYQEAIDSAAMAVPMIGTAYCYGNAYIGMTGTSGRMTPGSSPSQAGPKSNPTPNQSAGNSSGQGDTVNAPSGYTQDASGKWHRPNGQFATNQEVGLSPGNTATGYHATRPEFVESIRTNGFRESTSGRAGGGGVYVNNTPQGALAEYAKYNPNGPPAEMIKVQYNPGANVIIENPGAHIKGPLPIYGESLSFESTQLSGTYNTIVRNGSIRIVKSGAF